MDNNEILKLAIDALTFNFNEFIESCIDENGNIKKPSAKDLARARACIPKGYSMSLNNKL